LKTRMAAVSLFTLCLALAAVPATGQVIYSNGPTNGNSDSFDIGFGFVESDTFNVPSNNTTITGANFAFWLTPGDVITSAQLTITSAENGGTVYFNSTVSLAQSGCVFNFDNKNVCNEAANFAGPTLNSGTFWLNLQNGEATDGDPVFWDENSGPSSASQNRLGTIPSESFTVLGLSSSTSGTGTVPEPGSLMLFASGILGAVGVVRRKLF
jgi:hypothetical protein